MGIIYQIQIILVISLIIKKIGEDISGFYTIEKMYNPYSSVPAHLKVFRNPNISVLWTAMSGLPLPTKLLNGLVLW